MAARSGSGMNLVNLFWDGNQRPMRIQKCLLMLIGAVASLLFVLYVFWPSISAARRVTAADQLKGGPALHSRGGFIVRPFKLQRDVTHLWFVSNCLKTLTKELKLERIGSWLNVWKNSKKDVCRNLFDQFSEIYQVQTRRGEVVIPDAFMQKLRKWLKDDPVLLNEAKSQTIISLTNLYTQESTVFNPLRGKRPGAGEGAGPEEKQYVDLIVEKASHDCDFCNYKEMTSKNPFEVPENENCAVVSNTFKLESFHGLVLWKHHHPLVFDEKQILDTMDIAQKWFQKAHEHDREFDSPHIYWDVLPKASASQIHPHLHVVLASQQYYAKWNRLHEASLDFAARHHGANYFSALLKLHDLLGLTVHMGEASLMAYLTPQASFEVVLMSAQPGIDMFKLLYHTLKAFVDDLNLYAISAGMVFPKLALVPGNGDLPMIIRIVYRGLPSGSRSDVSSIELFGTPNVNVDPFKLIESLKSSIARRSQ